MYQERPKRLRENDFGGDTDDPVAIEEGFTKTEAEISAAANRMLHRSSSGSDMLYERRFRAHFGVSPQVAARTWDLLQSRGDPQPDEATIDRFLWGLLLLMVYDVEQVNCTHAAGVDEQTFREWSWHFIDAISYLEADVVGLFACFLSLSALANLTSKFMSQQIIWENRKHGDEGNDCMTSVDGADFRFQAHGKTFYSFKIKKGGLRYLVALCIKTGHIAYIDGPFPAGMMNDLTIFRWGMKGWLGEGERVEADDGYVGEAPQYSVPKASQMIIPSAHYSPASAAGTRQ